MQSHPISGNTATKSTELETKERQYKLIRRVSQKLYVCGGKKSIGERSRRVDKIFRQTGGRGGVRRQRDGGGI